MTEGDKEKRIVKMVTEDQQPFKAERIKKLMMAMSEALIPYEPTPNEILSAINTLQAMVLAKTGNSIEYIRKTLREVEDSIVETVLRERGDQR